MKRRESSFGKAFLSKKRFALLEMAIVLCSVFLVALPVTGIAADSEDDFILEIYGNANEDDTIDMQDYTYTARIICWLEDETTFADANYDGRISVADMTQIGLIILGRESELTLIDSGDKIVTVKKPVERIVEMNYYALETMRSLGVEKDRIVGVSDFVIGGSSFFPEFSDYPCIGGLTSPDLEKVLELEPDAVFVIAYWVDACDDIQEKLGADPSIAVLRFNFFDAADILTEEIIKLGYILGKREEADEYIELYEGMLDTIKERVEDIPEGERQKVYFEGLTPYSTGGQESTQDQVIVLAGGINIFSDLTGYLYEVDPEIVVISNPDVIVKLTYPGLEGGYEVDDPTKAKELRDEIMGRPELAEVPAVKNERVYVMSWEIFYAINNFVCVGYMAKWSYPDFCEDLDPQAMHQEYLDRFQRIGYDLDEHGVFVYPALEES